MSRTLARLRATTGDALLVPAGRGLVPTPRAVALRERVQGLSHDVRALLRPTDAGLDVARLVRTFTVRANDGFVEAFGARLVAAVAACAPEVRLCFAPKANKDVRPLREGLVDLDIGVLGETGPEVRVSALFRDRFVGVVRHGHPLAASPEVTPERYVDFGHVVTSRRGRTTGPVDAALAEIGLARKIVVVVPSFPAAVSIAMASDLVALIPLSFIIAQKELRGEGLRAGVQTFPLPVRTAPITVSQMWHPRADADPAHRWLRGLVLSTCHDHQF